MAEQQAGDEFGSRKNCAVVLRSVSFVARGLPGGTSPLANPTIPGRAQMICHAGRDLCTGVQDLRSETKKERADTTPILREMNAFWQKEGLDAIANRMFGFIHADIFARAGLSRGHCVASCINPRVPATCPAAFLGKSGSLSSGTCSVLREQACISASCCLCMSSRSATIFL